MALYAGQGVDKINAIVPAGERLATIVSEAKRLLTREAPEKLNVGKPKGGHRKKRLRRPVDLEADT